jgi:hypothetical protein
MMEEEANNGRTASAIRGALAGLAATAPMTAVIAAGGAFGLLFTPPPAQITGEVSERAGEQLSRRSPEFTAAWLAAHFAYGAACGALYGLLRPLLPRADVIAGVMFGGAVWGVSYLGLLPSLGLFPSAKDDAPPRQAVMIAAHAVYGTTLAGAERLLLNAQ